MHARPRFAGIDPALAVGIGENVAGFDDYLRDGVASAPGDFVAVQDASDLGAELRTLISEVCDECADCSVDGQLAQSEFARVETDPATGECLAYDFVPDGDTDDNVTYAAGSFTSKDGETYEPMTVTFETGYCDLHALVKSGRELEAQSFKGTDGSVTVEPANDGRFAISSVAFYRTEDAATEALEQFPSRGRPANR